MTRARFLPRAATWGAVALLAAALLTAALIATAPAKASTDDVIIGQPFAADSTNRQAGDTCPMGATRGTLGWHPGARTVEVTGTIADHPLPGDTDLACGEDGRFTTVTFAAYSAGGARKDTKSQKADNGQQRISTSLNATEPIVLVTVQVCRTTLDPAPFTYCGALQKYPVPPVAAG